MAEGLVAIPRWISASAAYRMDYVLDEEYNEEILYEAIPKRLAPKVKFDPVDVLSASLKLKEPLPTPQLWRFMRETISSAIDAPTSNHPGVLKDENNEVVRDVELEVKNLKTKEIQKCIFSTATLSSFHFIFFLF